MQTNSHLDWLQVTFPVDFDMRELSPFAGGWKAMEYGMLGYKQGYKSESGVRAYTGGSERMGVHVICGGDALEVIRKPGVTDQELCQFTSEHHGRASRLDMTINLINSPLTVRHVVSGWKSHHLHTPARNGWEDRGVHAPGHTLYVGSETSDRRARVYDKYAETAVKDPEAFAALKDKIDSWMRFELQARNERARGYQGALTYNPTEDVVKQAMRDFIDWGDETYLEAVSGPDVPIPDLPRKPPVFWKWAADQFIPAAVKFQLDNPSDNVMFVLNLLFEQRRKQELGRHGL